MTNVSAILLKSNELVAKGVPLRAAIAASFGYGDTDVQRKGRHTLRATANGYVRRIVDKDTFGAVRKERQA